MNFATRERVIDVGPAGFHPPSAMELGVTHPDFGPPPGSIPHLGRQERAITDRTHEPAPGPPGHLPDRHRDQM